MALKYLQENDLQEKLNTVIKELAVDRPEDLYYALGTELANFTKPAEILDERTLPEDGSEEVIRSPLDYTTKGKLQITKIKHQNKIKELSTFFKSDELSDQPGDGAPSEMAKTSAKSGGKSSAHSSSPSIIPPDNKILKNFIQAKLLWLDDPKLSSADFSLKLEDESLPIAFTLVCNTSISKFKGFKRVYFSSKNCEKINEVSLKIGEAIFASLPKPKGVNADVVKMQSALKNSSGAFENFCLEKIENILDLFSKNIVFNDGSGDLESGGSKSPDFFSIDFSAADSETSEPAYNGAKNKYEPAQGLLKSPNEMVDFYADIIKKYGNFLKVLINPFLKADHEEMSKLLIERVTENGGQVKIFSSQNVEEVGQNEEGCKILNLTSDANIQDKRALNWHQHCGGKYELVLMDGLANFQRYQ